MQIGKKKWWGRSPLNDLYGRWGAIKSLGLKFEHLIQGRIRRMADDLAGSELSSSVVVMVK